MKNIPGKPVIYEVGFIWLASNCFHYNTLCYFFLFCFLIYTYSILNGFTNQNKNK